MKSKQLLGALIFILAMMIYLGSNPNPNLQVMTEYLVLLPPSLLLIVSLYGVKSTNGVSYIGSWFFTGVSLAYMAATLNTAGALIPTVLIDWGITLQYLQVLLILASTGLGILFSKS